MKDIQTAVHKMLQRVVDRVNKRGLFKISRIVPAGSMEEKTAVWKYSCWKTGELHTEFDYLGVLGCPRDIIHPDQKCGQCVKLRKMPVTKNDLHEYQEVLNHYNNDKARCGHMFWREINTCLGSDCKCFSVALDDVWCFTYKLAEGCTPDYRCDKCVVEMSTGFLRVNNYVSVMPDGVAKCSLAFCWTSKDSTLSAYDNLLRGEAREINFLTIHVDFLPAIEVLKSGAGIAANEHDYFLVPKNCNVCDNLHNWRKSNCLTEIAHIVSEMSEKHRKCYKIIITFLSIIASDSFYPVINGYHMKTMVLNHSRECLDSSEGCPECVLKILAELKHAYEAKRVNSFHDSDVNICGSRLHQHMSVVEAAIEILCSVTDSDSCTTILEDAKKASQKINNARLS